MPGLEAGLAEQRGLLVAGDAADRDAGADAARPSAVTPKRPLDGTHLGQHVERARRTARTARATSAASRMSKSIVRLALVASVACTAPAGELPEQPRVDGAERRGRAPAATPPSVKSHSSLVAEKYGSSTRPVAARTSGRWPASRSCVAAGGGAAVLPDDGPVQRPAGAAVPGHDGLALVGDADGGDRLAGVAHGGADLAEHVDDARPRSRSASCSTQPGLGEVLGELPVGRARSAGPCWSKAMARTPVVPASMAITTAMDA